MKHTIHTKESLGNNHWFIEIELFPENDYEINAILKVEIAESSDEEIELVENYLYSALGDLSIVSLMRQKKNLFALTAKR